MNERALRDDLERLQVESRALEAELLMEHGPTFVERRTVATAQLGAARSALAALERASLTANSEASAARAQVERLADELHTLEQRRLSSVPFVLVPAVCGLAWVVLIRGPDELLLGAVAVACALSLGVLFGPRLVDWAQPGRSREPLVPNLTQSFVRDVWRNHGIVALGLSLGAGLMALLVGLVFWREVSMEGSPWWVRWDADEHFVLSLPVHLLGASGALLAMRARRRVQERGGTGRLTALFAAGLGVGSVLIIAVTWLPELRQLGSTYRATLPLARRLVEAGFALSSIALLLPLGVVMRAQALAEKQARWRLGAAAAFAGCSLVTTAALWFEAPSLYPRLREGAALWLALQFGVAALLLTLGFKARWRWGALAVVVAALAVFAQR